MMQSEGPEQAPNPAADRRLWQRCRTMDADEDEAARFLDLAAYADGLLDIEERERVAALLAADPEAAADVRAAQALAVPPNGRLAGLERIIARASAISPDADSGKWQGGPARASARPPPSPEFCTVGKPCGGRRIGRLARLCDGQRHLACAQRSSAAERHRSASRIVRSGHRNFLRDLGEGMRT